MASTGDGKNTQLGESMRTLRQLQLVRGSISIPTPTTKYEQRTYGKLGQLFQRLAGLADSQEGGKRDGHRLPGLQLCLGQST